MNRSPRSWTASLVGFTLTVLAVCFALNLAAQYLLDALPVLLPTFAVLLVIALVWRWWSNRPRGW